MTILELKNVNLTLNGKRILSDLSIDFWAGHIHAVVGPNGAGKSTMASVVMGLQGYRNIGGEVLYNNFSINHLQTFERARLGLTLAWQEPARFEGLRVADFLACSAKEKNGESIARALSAVGLEPQDYLTRAVDKTLSGGERKRIELASILLMKPALVLLDEPDSGIDVEALEKIFSAIKLLKNSGTTVIMITHSKAVLRQAEHAFLLCDGKLVDKGSAAKIGRYFEEKCLSCQASNAFEIVSLGQ